jgi:hypothetical protein
MFGFALQVVPEYPPGCIGNSKGQAMVLHHVGGSQIFKGDGLVVLHIVMRGFMESILALVVDALMDTGNLFLGLLTAVAALFAVSQFLLSLSKLLRTLLGMFRVWHDVPVAINDQIAKAHIQANGMLVLGQRLRFSLADALQIPARGTQDETGKLEGSLHLAMQHQANTPTTLFWGMEVGVFDR